MSLKLKIHVLVDNLAGKICKSEHGLSYWIEYDKKILFDFGQSRLFLDNARINKWPIEKSDFYVLSHGHYDHGNGLRYLQGGKLIAHPEIFRERYTGKERKPIGIKLSQENATERFNLNLSREPIFLSDKMVFLGEIPRKLPFENQPVGFWLANNIPDYIPDDTGLAIILPEGLFIISGCAHSGICNIINHAISITGVSKVYGVMGGFHLQQNNQQTKETIRYLKELGVKKVIPSHCTELPALSSLYNEFKFEQIKAGTLYTFPK